MVVVGYCVFLHHLQLARIYHQNIHSHDKVSFTDCIHSQTACRKEAIRLSELGMAGWLLESYFTNLLGTTA